MSIPKTPLRFQIVVSSLAYLLLGLTPLLAIEFSVKGKLHHEVWNSYEKQEAALDKYFSVDLRDSVWLLKTWGPGKDAHVYELGYEAGELFRLYTFIQHDHGANTNKYSTLVKNGEIPDDDASLLNYLWLAYCSTGFVAGRTEGKLEPIWQMDDPTLNAEGFQFAAHITQSSSASPPSMVTYFSDGAYRLRDGNGPRRLVWASPPYNQGYTNAIYQAQTSTNINGIELPASWTFVRYMPERNSPDRNRLRSRTITRGLVDSISPRVSVTSLRPIPPDNVLIRDERFAQVKKPVAQTEVRYSLTNGVWPSTADLRPAYTNSLREYEQSKLFQADNQRINSHRRFNAALAFGLTTLAVC